MIEYINNIMGYQEPNIYELVAKGLAVTLILFITIFIIIVTDPLKHAEEDSIEPVVATPIEHSSLIEPVIATPIEENSLIEPVVATPIEPEDHHFTPILMFPSPPFIIPQPTAPHFITPALMLPPPP